jgi:hypothetical protein
MLAILAALFAGCSQTEGKTDANPPAGSNADTSTPAATDTPAADESDTAASPKFGQAYTWDDGLSLKVSKPKPFKPSEYAATTGKGTAVKFTFTIVNKTDKPYDPSLFYATLQSGNTEAGDIFDSENGIEGSPSTKVLPGREAKFDMGWMAKNPKDLVLEVSPDAGIEYESVIFTS